MESYQILGMLFCMASAGLAMPGATSHVGGGSFGGYKGSSFGEGHGGPFFGGSSFESRGGSYNDGDYDGDTGASYKQADFRGGRERTGYAGARSTPADQPGKADSFGRSGGFPSPAADHVGAYTGYSGINDEKKEIFSAPNYNYEYTVADDRTGDFKNQKEFRDGDKVEGFYAFREADGTMREVHYTADKNGGFNAIVKKTGKAHHPSEYYTEDGKKTTAGHQQYN